MKFSLVICLLILGGCCRDYYNLADYPSPSVQINLNYRYNGLSPSDTMFEVRTFFYGGYQDYAIFYAVNTADSQKTIALYNILNTEKIIIESTSSNFSDTLLNMGYNSKEVRSGSKRCGYYQNQYFNIHCTYKGQPHSSGESSTLDINLNN